ncbi:hypothetical protein, partial [Delftia acidovorans]|uniref:hypothetical protein n=1 Tax=Delftia acidovorans TaxID=80866 RepID=UPI003C6D5249
MPPEVSAAIILYRPRKMQLPLQGLEIKIGTGASRRQCQFLLVEHRASSIEHRASSIEHRASSIEHRA